MLNAYSFISRQLADLAFNIYRLVHLAIQSQLQKEELLAQQTKKVVMRLENVFLDNNYQNKSVQKRYLTYVRYTLESDLIDKGRESKINLVQKIRICLYSNRRFNKAKGYFVEVAKTSLRVLGQEHLDILTSIANLASTYQNQRRQKEAEDLEV